MSPGDHDDIDVLRLGDVHRVVVMRGVVILLDVPLCIGGANPERVLAGGDVFPWKRPTDPGVLPDRGIELGRRPVDAPSVLTSTLSIGIPPAQARPRSSTPDVSSR